MVVMKLETLIGDTMSRFDKLFKRNVLERISCRINDRIVDKIGPPSERHRNAATAEEWVAFDSRSKIQCPVLYRIKSIIDGIEMFFSVRYRKYVTDKYYFLRNVFKHPMWICRAKTLTVGEWVDTDTRILHMNMQMLVDFIEGEKGRNKDDFKPWEVVEWEKHQNGEESEINDGSDPENHDGIPEHQWGSMVSAWGIYLWWKDYDNRKKEIDSVYEEIPNDDFGKGHIMSGFTKKERERKKPYYDRIHKLEERLDEEEKANLIKLMEIRKSLWV